LYECCFKCIQISKDYLESSWEINTFQTLTILLLLKYSSLILIRPCSSRHRFSRSFPWNSWVLLFFALGLLYCIPLKILWAHSTMSVKVRFKEKKILALRLFRGFLDIFAFF
jgi:hypothetical protein